MDEDLVLVDNCHTETMDPASRPTSPICIVCIRDPGSDAEPPLSESKCVKHTKREKRAEIRRASRFGLAAKNTGYQTSGSKDFVRTQEVDAGDQLVGCCVTNTRTNVLSTDPRPGLPHRRKCIRTEKSGCESPGMEETYADSLRSLTPVLDSPPPPPPPSFPAPPPPPPLSFQPFMNPLSSFTPVPPPPPLPPLPPPPPPPPSYLWPHFPPDFEVNTAEQLIPVRSAEVSAHSTTSSIVGFPPFQRKALLMRHQAHAADYQEYEWLLRFADTGVWYEKPNRSQSVSVGHHDGTPSSSNKVIPMMHPKPVCQELPKVWASAALTTSLDNTTTVVDQRRSKALKREPLVYCLVMSTHEYFAGMVPEKCYGLKMYKLVRCGSREAAVTEAFFAAGVQGYDVAFACVMRLDEDFAGTFGKAKRVEQLSDLDLENYFRENVRVFY